MYKNRVMAPQRNLIDFIEIKDENNKIIISQDIFYQPVQNYLCSTEINGDFTEKKINDIFAKVIHAASDPMHGSFEK